MNGTNVKPDEFHEKFYSNENLENIKLQDKYIRFMKVIDKKYDDGIKYMKKTGDYNYEIDWSDIPKESWKIYNHLRRIGAVSF